MGGLYDEHLLQEYSNNLLWKFIEGQVVYFSNNKLAVDAWIIDAVELFDNFIIHDLILISGIPPVTFYVCRSMQNIQWMMECGCVNKKGY